MTESLSKAKPGFRVLPFQDSPRKFLEELKRLKPTPSGKLGWLVSQLFVQFAAPQGTECGTLDTDPGRTRVMPSPGQQGPAFICGGEAPLHDG